VTAVAEQRYGDLLRARPPLRRRALDTVASAVMVAAALTALTALAFILWFLVRKGASVISWSFLTTDIPQNARVTGGGMYPAIIGTLLMTGAAAAMAVPLGVLGAVYLNEFGKQRRLARFIRFMADVMTGVPSIVMGLFIYTVWVIRLHQFSGLAGSFALACLMLPVVIRSTEEMLRLVPVELRQASQALGARTWRTTLTVVLPAALSGIVSGAMLAIARAAGETAPLIFTIGVVYRPNRTLSGPNTALSTQIFRNASQPFPGAQARAWGAALTLVAIVFAFTLLARVVSRRFSTGLR
jgi:phosphate transport system permease protein